MADIGTKPKDKPPLTPAMAEQIAPSAVEQNPRSRNVCSVGCKLPHGIILELDQKVGDFYTGTGDRIELLGANSSAVFGGYGITENVDEELFDAIMEQKKGFPPIKSGLIFKQSSVERAEDQAVEHAAVRSGLEPLDPNKPAPGLKPFDAKDGA